MSDATTARNQYARLLDRAMRILAMRDHSEAEFRQKLTFSMQRSARFRQEEAPEIAEEDIEKVVAWCYEHSWLDDTRFAERFVASRSRKGYGPQRIRMELGQKGIGRELTAATLEGAEIDWSAQAFDVAERKFGLPLPTEWKEKAKVQRYLLSKGFFMEDIQAIFRNFDN
ncbi:recombination regulator RecX [Erwiniaceae bacterium BAC15a-03b]|uniref:Regulatory protein RecX n=1 Tax=Winslowiella arboricola TaxID=2978220 RepID=A0A9J6PUZ6_9GAMM|nr:regulatory protein RecX [Winslowiella arboricola]MCU5773042.1 recombination regulator RecX [Winslowiella arboricola]MCU5777863.1 recombination regulator RecX [Winslowiella arboricola]